MDAKGILTLFFLFFLIHIKFERSTTLKQLDVMMLSSAAPELSQVSALICFGKVLSHEMCVSKGRHQLVYEAHILDASSYSINPFALFSDIKTGARNKGNCSLSTACVTFSQLKVSYYL